MGIGVVELGVAAAGADHAGETLPLHVEDLRPEAAGAAEFSGFVDVVLALGAVVADAGHCSLLR